MLARVLDDRVPVAVAGEDAKPFCTTVVTHKLPSARYQQCGDGGPLLRHEFWY